MSELMSENIDNNKFHLLLNNFEGPIDLLLVLARLKARYKVIVKRTRKIADKIWSSLTKKRYIAAKKQQRDVAGNKRKTPLNNLFIIFTHSLDEYL